jgi:drug/metabolite transporter (DMT)-like permease
VAEALLPIGLGLFSAVTLAAANMSVKMGTDILAARALLSVSAAILVVPFLFLVPAPDGKTWIALAVAVPAHFFYQACLVNAMQRGDLSLVFPLMRGAAPLLTGIAAFLLLGEALAPFAILGLLIATGAVIVFALPAQGTRMRHHPDRAAILWAFATAVGIALYNVADARGVRMAANPFTYILWLFLLDAAGVTSAAVLRRRHVLVETVRAKWRYGAVAGVLSIFSYGAAVYAFSLAETARVSAMRETSVVFAALMGAAILKEGFGRRRIAAALALAAGLVLMQFSR